MQYVNGLILGRLLFVEVVKLGVVNFLTCSDAHPTPDEACGAGGGS